MSTIRTRKLAAVRLFLAAAGIVACASSLAAAPDATDLQVQLQAAANPASLALAPLSVAITGKAPARCAPTIGHAGIDGVNLNIEMRAPQTDCPSTSALSFYLPLDPAKGARVMAGQVYRTRIYSMENGTAQLLAFGLLDTNPHSSAPVPESGLWWSEARAETGAAVAGNGASIELQDGQLAVGLLGFDEGGDATWYFGTGPASGRVARVPLVRLAHGDPLFAASGNNQPLPQPGPRIEVEFLSPSRANAWLVRNEGGRDVEVRALALSRSRFASGPIGTSWNGQWVLVPDDGTASRIFEFAAAGSQDAENFHLADATGEASLDCRLIAGTEHPAACTLSGPALASVDFDQVGFDRLSGHTSTGARATLLRVTPR